MYKDTGNWEIAWRWGVQAVLSGWGENIHWGTLQKALYSWLILWVEVFRSVLTPLMISSRDHFTGLCSPSDTLLKPFAWLVFKHPSALSSPAASPGKSSVPSPPFLAWLSAHLLRSCSSQIFPFSRHTIVHRDHASSSLHLPRLPCVDV